MQFDAAFQDASESNSVTPKAVFQIYATAKMRTHSYHYRW